MRNEIQVAKIVSIAKLAGKAILNIYHHADFSKVVDFKTDNSPLTLADKAAHQVIAAELEKAYPEIPIISEEGADVPYEQRKDYQEFWLVDPLDGTKEFIKRNGEFTVNIALIENGSPVLGVVYVPVKDLTYYGQVGGGAFVSEAENDPRPISVNNKQHQRIAVRSKSHPSPEEEVVLNEYQVVESISRGSSLKFCMVAEGKADIYYRHGPTMEWDTAAGQAVVEAANGKVLVGTGPEPFIYNKSSLLNSSFLCLGF
ncbi:MAG: 3'(2'),5'-bisphosphate nucleotidase CysQ [Cyclobacteriaceae bacterium]|nr:MAG: 3'(2'),5'-bisphosphate nucleotidase CysQ [Cyclobacteriaceae bacterium]